MASQAIIRIAGSFPAFIGNNESGYNLTCKKCGQLLSERVRDRQILGLLIECPRCKAINPTQQREAGEAIPTRHVRILNGDYYFGEPIDVSNTPEAVVGENAVNDYHVEVGYKNTGSASAEALNGRFLKDLAQKAIALLGVATYKRHLSTITQSRASKTPKACHHRLVDLVQYSLECAERLSRADSEEVVIDGNLIAELWEIVILFNRWQRHPAWERLKQSLTNSNDVQHNLIQLAVASMLADQDNGVEVVFSASSGKIPDLCVRPTYSERLEVEVKTPVALHGPVSSLSIDEAVRTIERRLNKAASTKAGQIDSTHSGLFVLGGFHIRQELIPILENAAHTVLERQKHRKGHLIAIVICVVSYELFTIVDRSGRVITQSLQPMTVNKIVEHPGYKGQLKIGPTARPRDGRA